MDLSLELCPIWIRYFKEADAKEILEDFRNLPQTPSPNKDKILTGCQLYNLIDLNEIIENIHNPANYRISCVKLLTDSIFNDMINLETSLDYILKDLKKILMVEPEIYRFLRKIYLLLIFKESAVYGERNTYIFTYPLGVRSILYFVLNVEYYPSEVSEWYFWSKKFLHVKIDSLCSILQYN